MGTSPSSYVQVPPGGGDPRKCNLRTCSHEPGTVNYPVVIYDCPGARVTSHLHYNFLSRGNVAPGKFIVI